MKFERAAIICSAVSILCCSIFYISIPAGGLAILFALLSRGGKMELSTNAKLSIGLGIAGILLTIVIYTATFMMLLDQYGSMEAMLRALLEDAGYNYEEIYGDMFR